MKQIICLTSIVLVASAAAFADIPRPDKSPNRIEKPVAAISTTMEIKLDRDAKEAKLIIPRSQVKQLRAELERLDNGDDNVAVTTPDISRTQTIISGLFLSLAFIFGGMWFVRSGKAATKAGKTFVIIAAMAATGSVAAFVFANVGPPPEARSITSKLFDQKLFTPYRFASGAIKIETSDRNYVQLIVPDAPKAPADEE